ncbi:hypothetical protein EV284_6354 [Streptomyces sp. BK022]|uniref:hypothetical protein n=1 Tax=Streptomyces sp. BK022 TaxID=2512123 RepID=UPI001029CF96|nr:hypothetical protein [Streptomyces sp. BK022]RZU28188.1 hypothetical protein EV284_6354 [Streptomyces sp. BK022]
MSTSTAGGPRHKQKTPYVHIVSDTVRDTRLRYCDLGLLTYLWDQSQEWAVRSEQLSKGEGREGRDAIRKSLHRLAKYGYYRLERRRLLDGKTVMGTAVSDHPVEQWAADYETFGQKLDVPVVQQPDGTFRVKYPDGTLGSDGFTDPDDAPAAPDGPAADAPGVEDEPVPVPVPTPTKTPPAKTPAARKPRAPRKTPAQKAAEAEAKAAAAEQKQVEDALLDAEADEVTKWWWEHAEKHLGKYAGQKNAFVAVRKMVHRALDAGYTRQNCAKALIHARQHFPSAQQWQNALGVATNHIQPTRPQGRVAYSDSATWGGQDQDPTTGTGTGTAIVKVPNNDSDDATFGVVARPEGV